MKTFRGGIHVPDMKELAASSPVRRAGLPSRVLLPLRQNAGEPPCCIVKEGQKVRTGERIAEAAAGGASGGRSVPLHASISGTVAAIAEIPVPYGGRGQAIEIEGDGRDERAWGGAPPRDPFGLEAGAIVGLIREAGIVGLGGAEFPTHVKLVPPPGKTLDTLVVNGVECEPYLAADYRLMLERPGDVVLGTRLLMKAAGVSRAVIGIEENKRDAFDRIREASADAPGVTVELLRVKYPQGAEKQLIAALLGREVPSGCLPSEVGVVVQNVGTAVAVRDACVEGKPLYERIVTVSGSGVRRPGNLLVRIGTPFGKVLEECGGLTDDAAMLIMGGPMMGIAQWTTDVPVVKGTTGIIALAGRETPPVASQPCIRCGLCLRVCPMGLSPALIRRASESGLWEEAGRLGLADCMECGACAYVCATSRDQIQLYKRAKKALKEGGAPRG